MKDRYRLVCVVSDYLHQSNFKYLYQRIVCVNDFDEAIAMIPDFTKDCIVQSEKDGISLSNYKSIYRAESVTYNPEQNSHFINSVLNDCEISDWEEFTYFAEMWFGDREETLSMKIVDSTKEWVLLEEENLEFHRDGTVHYVGPNYVHGEISNHDITIANNMSYVNMLKMMDSLVSLSYAHIIRDCKEI